MGAPKEFTGRMQINDYTYEFRAWIIGEGGRATGATAAPEQREQRRDNGQRGSGNAPKIPDEAEVITACVINAGSKVGKIKQGKRAGQPFTRYYAMESLSDSWLNTFDKTLGMQLQQMSSSDDYFEIWITEDQYGKTFHGIKDRVPAESGVRETSGSAPFDDADDDPSQAEFEESTSGGWPDTAEDDDDDPPPF
jgi:hypothetical protein